MTSSYVLAVTDGRWAEAAKVIDSAIQSAEVPARQQLLINRGYCHHRLQLYRKALKDYDAALELQPKCAIALYRKGQVLSAQKKIEEARQAWEAALQACGTDTDAQLILDISAALRDPAGVKEVGADPESRNTTNTATPSCNTSSSKGAQQRQSLGGRALFGCLQLVTIFMLGLVLFGQHQLLTQQAGLAAFVAPAASECARPGANAPSTPAAATAMAAPPAAPPTNGWAHGGGSAATSASTTSTAQGPATPSPSVPSERTTQHQQQQNGNQHQQQDDLEKAAAAVRPARPPEDAGADSQPSTSGRGAAGSNGHGHVSHGHGAGGRSPGGKKGGPAKGAPHGAQGRANGECDVEEVDCVAAQQRKHQIGKGGAAAAGRAGAGAGGAGAGAGGGAVDMQTMLNNSMAIQLAVTQINSGLISEAEAILDSVIATSPRELGARVARGTARALRRNLTGAVEDFGVAIEVEPRYADSWKRRGQARSALGDSEGALADLQRAIDLAPLFGGADSATSRAECYVERGMIYQKLRDYRRACREMQQAVKLDATNPQAWNVLGLCSTSQGDIRDGVRAYERATELNPKLKEAWVNMGQALKEEGRTKEAERALTRALALDPPDQPSVHVLRVLAQMRQQLGEHAAAVRLLERAVPLAQQKEEQVIELLYLRAICHHALGAVREAVRDYDDCLSHVPRGGLANATEEARQFQFLSFYQKDMALYMYRSLDRKAADFCPDTELPDVFKELWCKKGPPTAELVAHYPPQPPLPLSPPPLPPGPDWGVLRPLTALADQLGLLLQNHHQGFLPNARQQRAAGYAALELAQALRAAAAAGGGQQPLTVSDAGSSGRPGGMGRHVFGWRDAMDIVVKWRQLAEPNDQVVWVDLLTRREFEQGFGSHTPMFSGQTKCVRYYMAFARALELQRQVLLREGHAFDAANTPIPVGSEAQREAIRQARTAEDMYNVIRQDSWVVVPISSVARPEVQLEGTRLTLVRVPNQPDAYEFSIRTPVTPPRWKDFDRELAAAFEACLQALAAGDRPLLARRAMTYAYYWYNFMPLARGTAAVGYTTLLAWFWAAGMPVTATIPKDYQVDWEAILAQHPDQFIASVSPWLYPPAARGEAQGQQQQAVAGEGPGAGAGAAAPAVAADAGTEGTAAGGSGGAPVFPPVDTLPRVPEVLGTIRQRLIALNGEGSKRYV